MSTPEAADNNNERAVATFVVPNSVINHREEALSTIASHPDLSSSQRDFLTNILEYAQQLMDNNCAPILEADRFQGWLASKGKKVLTIKSLHDRSRNLATKGFMSIGERVLSIRTPGRPPKEYRLAELHSDSFTTPLELELEYSSGGRRNYRAQTSSAIKKQIQDSEELLAAFADLAKHRTDITWTGLLDRVMRFSLREKPQENRINTKVRMQNVTLFVQSKVESGRSSEIAVLSDQRVIRAIISEVAHAIEESKDEWLKKRTGQLMQHNLYDELGDLLSSQLSDEDQKDLYNHIKNRFYIDVTKLAKRMGYSDPMSGAHRKTINDALRRLHETSFRVVVDPSNEASNSDIARLMHRYGLTQKSTGFRFIPKLESQNTTDFYASMRSASPLDPDLDPTTMSESDYMEEVLDPYTSGEHNRVRFWCIKIDDLLFDRLVHDTRSALYTIHDEIMRESNGLAQTLYNWVSYMVGRTDESINSKPASYKNSLKAVHTALWPWRTYNNFADDFVRIMRHYMDEAEFDPSLTYNVALMWGYVWTLSKSDEDGQLYLMVRRNKEDPLTGDNSFNNQRQRLKTTKTE